MEAGEAHQLARAAVPEALPALRRSLGDVYLPQGLQVEADHE
ncbi:hypothetical protein [Streptomyces sp. NPDC056169]